MKKEYTKLVIIGSGPSGYTSAIYASRAGLKPLLYKGKIPGGQLTTTANVENYPGYQNNTFGVRMMSNFEIQSKKFGTDIRDGFINLIDFSIYPYKLTTNCNNIIFSNSIIIATGASHKHLNIKFKNKKNSINLSYCAICDGYFFKKKNVAIIGGGDSAAEEALYLSNICNKVYMIIRKNKMRASYILQERVIKKKNIKILWNSEINQILDNNELNNIEIINNITKKKEKISSQGLFIAIGYEPNTKIFSKYLILDHKKYIKTISGSSQTNLRGVFASGDVQDGKYRQAITAASSGCVAAMDAEKFLLKNI